MLQYNLASGGNNNIPYFNESRALRFITTPFYSSLFVANKYAYAIEGSALYNKKYWMVGCMLSGYTFNGSDIFYSREVRTETKFSLRASRIFGAIPERRVHVRLEYTVDLGITRVKQRLDEMKSIYNRISLSNAVGPLMGIKVGHVFTFYYSFKLESVLIHPGINDISANADVSVYLDTLNIFGFIYTLKKK